MKAKKAATAIPEFEADAEVADFWEQNSLADFDQDLEVVPGPIFARPSKTVLSVRLDAVDIQRLETIAKRTGVSKSTLIRVLIKEKFRALTQAAPSTRRVDKKR